MNLVTGGCGFIGSHLVKLLADQGEQVRVLDTKDPVAPVNGVVYHKGSITDRDHVEKTVSGCGRIFHLAALSGLWGLDKKAFVTVNSEGTENVLQAARQARVETLVHTSTESVLIAMGHGRKPQAVNEQTERILEEMAGDYCRGKFLAEQMAWKAAEKGQRVIIVNPTVPAGPGDHWITPPTRMILGFLNGKYPAYLDSCLNLADARDIAMGHWLAAKKGNTGQRYILGGHNIRIGDLLSMLGKASNRSMPKRKVPYPLALGVSVINELVSDYFTRRPPAAPLAGVRLAGIPVEFNNDETRRQLGWSPRPLEETIADAIQDYHQRQLI